MIIALTEQAVAALAAAPLPVQKAFIKQMNFLARDLRHPGLHAKKYDEANDRWQARVDQHWRFYFRIIGDTYRIDDITPHPK